MPQVDLETLVSACAGASSDRKVACEPPPDDHPDSPPASFWLSGDAEYDWWDRNAVYERNESTKGNSISSSVNPNSNSNSNSQRFSKNLKSKAAIIGLPKPQKTSFADAKSRRCHRPGNARLFPKRSASAGGKSESSVIEPSSPKVSCIGRVRSKRDRNRRLRNRQRSVSSTVTAASAPAASAAAVTRQKSSRSQRKKTGFFESVRAIFRSGRRGKPVQKADLPAADSSSKKKRSSGQQARGSAASRNDASFEEPVSSAAPGLGAMNRFASGRRTEAWGVGESEIHVAQ
ncbi:uncharacterized protein LOC109816340 [Cajanus cajan]|uniref:Uncharacterized protein n=1 Tax=Cajanus cajan TaxID=3821 RepID=A0A151RRS6_CAJCA|nr:uncharacterized protein LOC109816340 [Cajanus cajan]KYP45252.1 hypothetical protein KK1_033205 [Cajanus cajan]